MSRRTILIVIGAALAAFPLLGASCSVDQTFTNSGLSKIQFEGDSITVQSTDDINAHFGAGYDVAVNAYTGATAYERMSSIAADAASNPQVAVINLGTNDAGAVVTGRTLMPGGVTVPWDPIEPIANVETRLDTIAADFSPACVVFVTINTADAPFYGSIAPAALANAEAINTHIRSMPGIQVADWDANLQASYFDSSAAAPHPNEAGRQELLTLEDQAISRCPPPETTTTSSGA